MRRGYTLVELTFVMLLMAMTGLTVLPAVHRLRDRMAVVGAREAVVGIFAEARVDALLLGGATVRVRSGPWRAWAEAGDSVLRSVDLERDFSVTVSLGRGRTSSDLRYDALGIGAVASETLTFRRGGEETALVVSGYGRVRRR
jgi:type II secretory pathway pseudopilin PulG